MCVRACVCVFVLGVSILPLSMSFLLNVLKWYDSVVFFEMLRQCGIFWNVTTVWYFLKCYDSVVFLKCYDSVVFLKCYDMWYF